MRPKRLRPDTKRIKWEGEPSRRLRSKRKFLLVPLFLFLALVLSLILFGRSWRDSEQPFKRAVEAWDAGDYKSAAEEYERFIESNPAGEKSLEARFQLANIYYLNLRRADQARIHYQEILNQEPSHPDAGVARERMAEILAELGRSYEAISEYEKLHPQDEKELRRIRLRIADLYFDQKNYSQALTEYEKVTRANYDELSEQAHLREASIYHIARGQHQQALPIYKKLADSSGDPEVRLRATYAIADCYAGLYQFEEAIKTLREVKIDGEQSYIARRVAELERQKREAAQARNAVQSEKGK
jgi:tetratricopeptide (TPR) repeat protein